MAASFGGKLEAATVAGDELICLFVKTVPGQPDVGMWNRDTIKPGVVKVAGVSPFHHRMAIAPVPIDRKDKPA